MIAIGFGSNVRRLTLNAITVLAMAMTASQVRAETASETTVAINTAFPGGNAKVTANADGSVHLEPDLRGGRPWFYWCFEATSTKPGKMTFVFPEKVAGFKNGAIGFQGPAISTDLGKTWKWMGTEQVDGDSFSYDFAKAHERVRFAVTIPYVQTDLDDFLKKNTSNPHLEASVLTKSRNGREVELLQIGSPGPEVMSMLVTGRHHAAETIASYVLEGFLQEAMSESESAKEFRKKYVLYAVPFVDKDGVEEGDQGKNRRPHDHNRDYGDASIYPEIQAIKKLDKEKNFRFALDFHCPTLVMNDHQVMYFVGPKEHPKYNFQNVSELAGWIKKGLPKTAPVGPYVWLRPAKTPTPMNSHYFGFKDGTIMAATLEIPFAPPGKATDPSSCRIYGQTILAAWVNTHFLAADEKPAAKDEKPAAPKKKVPQVAAVPDKFEWLPPEATGKGSFVGRLSNFKGPVDVHFHDNTLIGNRRLGLGYCGGRRWLIEDNLFAGNGGTAPGYGIDLEDGWEFMQDVVIRNNSFKDNVRGDLVICAGSELLIEGNTFENNVVLHARPHNYTFRNNKFNGGHVGYKTRTGVARIHDNMYENCTLSIVFDTKAVADGINRKPGETVATPPLTLTNETLVNVEKITGTYFNFTGATMKQAHFVAGKDTSLIGFKKCDVRESIIQYEAEGPQVRVEVEGHDESLKQAGPGLNRRRSFDKKQ